MMELERDDLDQRVDDLEKQLKLKNFENSDLRKKIECMESRVKFDEMKSDENLSKV